VSLVPSLCFSSISVTEFIDDSNDGDDDRENWDEDTDDQNVEDWDVFSISEVHDLRHLVHSNNPWDENGLEEKHNQELNMSSIGVEEVEVPESSLNNKHQTPDEREDGNNENLVFFSHLSLKFWEPVLSKLDVVVEESKNGINTEAYTHDEEDNGPEVSTWQESEQGWEGDEKECWS
jgi:hypothetical protein